MHRANAYRRRAAAVAMVAIAGTTILGIAALAIDMGLVYRARNEAQRSADAGALAGTWKLLDEQRLLGTGGVSTVVNNARSVAVNLSGANKVFNSSPTVDANADVQLGRIENPRNRGEALNTGVDPSQYNSVGVTIHRDSTRNGAIPLFFAQIFGQYSKDLSARAVANASDAVVGYRVTERSGNAEILPLALQIDCWNKLLNRSKTTGDSYAYDPTTRTVSAGSDGIYELNLYPGAGPTQLTPGNFGTVDIGSSNNSTSDISRQIRYGVSAEDLAYFGGELRFNSDGVLILNGDTGLSAAIKDDLTAIKGLPRSIPLFETVTGPGNNAMYQVVAFAGIRILNVRLTGSMKTKEVIIQPAVVIDDSVITDETHGPSYYVFAPPALIR